MDDLMNLEVERAQELISDSLKKLVNILTADQFLRLIAAVEYAYQMFGLFFKAKDLKIFYIGYLKDDYMN